MNSETENLIRKPKKPGCGTIISLALILLVGLTVTPIVLEFLLWAAGGFLVVADPLETADAIVVLSGGENLARVEEAILLYQEGNAEWVILTETEATYPNTNSPYTGIHKRELMAGGVPEDAILITDKIVDDTYGEARVIRKLMLRQSWKTCIVVTDPFHTRRTRLVFGSEFSPHDLQAIIRPARNYEYSSAFWWLDENSRLLTISEYAKFFAFYIGLH